MKDLSIFFSDILSLIVPKAEMSNCILYALSTSNKRFNGLHGHAINCCTYQNISGEKTPQKIDFFHNYYKLNYIIILSC